MRRQPLGVPKEGQSRSSRLPQSRHRPFSRRRAARLALSRRCRCRRQCGCRQEDRCGRRGAPSLPVRTVGRDHRTRRQTCGTTVQGTPAQRARCDALQSTRLRPWTTPTRRGTRAATAPPANRFPRAMPPPSAPRTRRVRAACRTASRRLSSSTSQAHRRTPPSPSPPPRT